MKARDAKQEQFIHLVRLAWDLHKRGLNGAVDLSRGKEPVLLLYRVPAPLTVMASFQEGRWFFTWGRGRDQRTRALAEDAAERVWEVAQ